MFQSVLKGGGQIKPDVLLPNPTHYAVTNAARLASFALAAYGKRTRPMREALDSCDFWEDFEFRNTRGLVVCNHTIQIIAIAGSNDTYDWRHNFDFWPTSISEFKRSRGLPAEGSSTCGTHTGFLTHAAQAAKCLRPIFDSCHTPLEREHRSYICGHSLGGAAAILLPHMMSLKPRLIATYGSPRVFSWDSKPPGYETMRIVQQCDCVPSYPRLMYRHPPSEVRYIRYEGSVKSVRHAPTWLARLCRMAFYVSTGNPLEAAKVEHSMSGYNRDLRALIDP